MSGMHGVARAMRWTAGGLGLLAVFLLREFGGPGRTPIGENARGTL